METAKQRLFDENSFTPRPVSLHKLIYGGVAVALLCAACVFFSLYRRDRSWFLAIATPAKATVPVPLSDTPSLALAPAARPLSDTVVATPSSVRVKSESAKNELVNKKLAPLSNRFGFALKHSRFYQSVGPIRLKLLRTNVRHSNADLSMIVAGRRTDRKFVALDEPLPLAGSKGDSHSVALVLYGLNKRRGHWRCDRDHGSTVVYSQHSWISGPK